MSYKNKIVNQRLEKLIDHIYKKNIYKSTFSYDQLDKIQNHQHVQSSHLQFNSQSNRKNYFKNFLYNYINKYHLRHSKNLLLYPPTSLHKIEPSISLKISSKLSSLNQTKQNQHSNQPTKQSSNQSTNQPKQGTKQRNDKGQSIDRQQRDDRPREKQFDDRQQRDDRPREKQSGTHISSLYDILENKDNKKIVQIQLKYADVLLFGVCAMIYDQFLSMKDKDKYYFMKQVKYKMALDLDIENLYEKFNYRYKKFKKTALQNELLENKLNVHNFFYVYLGDYFNLNIIIAENNQLNYINKYDKYRYSILFTCINGNYSIKYDINSNHNFINHDTLTSLFDLQNQDKKIQKTHYQKMKLGDLQQLVLNKNRPIKKKGKKGMINKTKKELIEILQEKNISS